MCMRADGDDLTYSDKILVTFEILVFFCSNQKNRKALKRMISTKYLDGQNPGQRRMFTDRTKTLFFYKNQEI